MKFGIIGGGRWAEVHKQALESLGETLDTVLVASEASKNRLERDWGLQATTNMQTFLSYGIEAVIVASPNYLHAEHSIRCLEAGKHVLVEKPFATTLKDAQAMIKAAKQSNKVLTNGLEMREFTLFKRVKELISEGKIGKPIHLNLHLWRRPYSAGSGGWKTDPEKLGSSTLEEPIHYLDLARWYLRDDCGEPTGLQAWANSREGRDYLNENLDIRFQYKDKTQALISRSIAAYEHSIRLYIVGEKGSLRAEWQGRMDLDKTPNARLFLHNSGNRDLAALELPVEQKTGHAYDLSEQTRAFIKAIKKGSSPAATAEDGLASVALSLAVDKSLKNQKAVLL